MSFSLTPSKRSYDRGLAEPNGKGKWQKIAGSYSHNLSLKISPGSIVFRILCPASKTGSVIGKGGMIISHIRQETGAKVRVEETVPGCEERIVVIVGSDKGAEVSNEVGKDDGEESPDSNAETEDGVDEKEHGEKDEVKESVPVEDLHSEKGTSSVQKALLLVFERMVEGESETDGGDDENSKSAAYVARLLVLSNQVGCLLGKGGSVIKQMSAESGAQIRILPRDKLPACASPSDELVQITGGLDAARKALQLVSQQLLENAPRDHESFPASSTGSSSHSQGHPLPRLEGFPPTSFPFPAQGASFVAGPRDGVDYHSAAPSLIPKFHESGVAGRMKPPQDILIFRLLCPDDKVGSIIGKGGTIIKQVQLDTGCEIKVLEGVADSEDRIIVISGPAHPDDRISAAQEAVLRIQNRIVRVSPDNFEKSVVARVLVSSNQIGCLLGKGGAIIAEMRKLSGAHIRILGKEQVPKCASENEEVVQVNGEFEAVQEALLQITSRLRHHFDRDAFPSINHPSNAAFPDQVPPFPLYMGRRELSPPGMYSNLGPSFHKFDAFGGLPPHGGFHTHDERSPFMPNIHRPVIPPQIAERKPSSAPWGPQGLIEGAGPLGLPDYAGIPQRRNTGFGGGNQPAIITNTTVEVIVPRSLVPVIYGEDGGCLKQIRQISDAKITITEPKPGATETVIIISGTPEQTHAAQSLIQAFVISETGTP
ncbi:KH domain-containing protein HEN4-like [Malania oleifera]|uniref:KH domain-containing protein HEN4-like n=1 Tax=Malania oleifera TaxID=397392 RepID=UPI0025AE5C1A|nr:KH domain-containing protein HEN4-like [Malania oleifera]XP_057972901.1 KH domain-containing protein HEN4-like [Malania oleifera]XP_057972902.1 KH domain-containing protein HEN4-like [Malania oleifera]XP_057972903.1 KH domain-containing protein HEN4-like [Malania oleifera]XP_057972904.1 KH domain-containing protein HEN4-like [Malania oleifera]